MKAMTPNRMTLMTAEQSTKKKKNYINNPEFLVALTTYKEAIAKAEREGLPKPRIPDYVGECFIKISTQLARKPNFANYPFKEEMIGDGIENCIMYMDNFDPEKSSNPFAYFTQIIYYAFLRRIQKEKKNLYIKYKVAENMDLNNELSERQEHESHQDFGDTISHDEYSQEYINNFITSFENSLKSKK